MKKTNHTYTRLNIVNIIKLNNSLSCWKGFLKSVMVLLLGMTRYEETKA